MVFPVIALNLGNRFTRHTSNSIGIDSSHYYWHQGPIINILKPHRRKLLSPIAFSSTPVDIVRNQIIKTTRLGPIKLGHRMKRQANKSWIHTYPLGSHVKPTIAEDIC